MDKIILLFLIIIFYFLVKREKFSAFNSIPNVIHKIYITDSNLSNLNDIDKNILNAIDSWKTLNPEYTLKIYFENDCNLYLKKNFSKEHLQCFNKLKPYAYKADFMRYCILYNEGGWYSDWQQKLLVPLDTINDKNYEWVSCYDETGQENKIKKCMQNSFLGCIKKNKILEIAINRIIKNVKNNHYGNGPWNVTGPCLLGNVFKENNNFNNFNVLLGFTFNDKNDGPCFNINNKKVIINKCCVSTNIPGSSFKNGNNYIELWKNRDIYNNFNVKESFGVTKKNDEICLLLTTCVNIKTNYYNNNNTSEVRLNVYKKAIDNWLNNTNLDIKIVESSLYPFNEYSNNPRVQIYSFQSNSKFKCIACEATPYEAESILLAFKNLNLKNYTSIIKITGKYYLPDFDKLINHIPQDADIFFQYTEHSEIKQQNSEFFGCKTIYLEDIMNLILRNSEYNMNFELTLFTLKNKYKVYRFPKIKLESPILRSGDNSYIYAL